MSTVIDVLNFATKGFLRKRDCEGTNTGDETQSSIISKLGYTPLAPNGSGANLTSISPENINYSGFTNIKLSQLPDTTVSIGQNVNYQFVWGSSYVATDTQSEYSTSTGVITLKKSGVYAIKFTAGLKGGAGTYSDKSCIRVNCSGSADFWWRAIEGFNPVTVYLPATSTITFSAISQTFSATGYYYAFATVTRLR